MKSQITVTAISDGYRMVATGRYVYGDNYSVKIVSTAAVMASVVRREIGKQIASNPEGYELSAPPEIIAALEAGPLTGRRISYYASAEAWDAIQSQREATGDSQSGAINALVLRNA